MRILITGPTGFLGSALANYWEGQGHKLCLITRSLSKMDRIRSLATRVRLECIADAADVIAILQSFVPDAVVHTACAYGRSGEPPLSLLDSNIRLGVALLQATIERAETPTVFLNTGTALSSEVSLYALSKNQFSNWGAALALQQPKRLQFINIRLQQMYGPGDDRSKFTTHVIDACRLNETFLALTPGEQRRDFIHVADTVRAYDKILCQHKELAVCDSIDVGSGTAVSIRTFVELVQRLTDTTTKLNFGSVPYRPNEAMLCVADTSRLRALGWSPEFELEAGLKHTLAANQSPPSLPLDISWHSTNF